MLYNLIGGCTSSWVIFHNYSLFMDYSVKFTFVFICLLMLYIWLLRYVCVVHMIRSLFALHLGNLVMNIYCLIFVVPLSPSSLTYIHNSVLPSCCLKYFPHELKHISLYLVYQYLVYLFLLYIFSVVFNS